MATIEIRAKIVFEIDNYENYNLNREIHHAYHSYIIYTKDNGDQYILRAGPSNQDIWEGDLEVVGVTQDVLYTDETHGLHRDWPKKRRESLFSRGGLGGVE